MRLVALVGVGDSAIASHRRARGAVLVFAWIPSLIAVLFDFDFFFYVKF